MNNDFKEFEWEDEVNQESSFTLLEEGDYRFRMVSMERGRHNGSDRIPPCNKAICTLDILDDDGNKITSLKHNLFLHSSVEGLLSSFFIATGAKKHGEPLNIMKGFNDSTGRVGWCHLFIDKWKGNDGKDRESNKIKYFIDPEKAPKTSPKTAPAAPQAQFSGWGNAGGANISNR